jgi:hypothetical protein
MKNLSNQIRFHRLIVPFVRVKIVADGSRTNMRHQKITLIGLNSRQCLNLKKSQNTTLKKKSPKKIKFNLT